MRISEALWTQHEGCTDTFCLLCEKLKRLKVMEEMKSDMKIEDELQRWYKMGVRHDGTPIGQSMLYAERNRRQ